MPAKLDRLVTYHRIHKRLLLLTATYCRPTSQNLGGGMAHPAHPAAPLPVDWPLQDEKPQNRSVSNRNIGFSAGENAR